MYKFLCGNLILSFIGILVLILLEDRSLIRLTFAVIILFVLFLLQFLILGRKWNSYKKNINPSNGEKILFYFIMFLLPISMVILILILPFTLMQGSKW